MGSGTFRETHGGEMTLSHSVNTVRIAFFLSLFLVMAILEVFFPRRPLRISRKERWLINLSITFGNAIMLRFLIPLGATGMAILATEKGWGLLNLAGASAGLNFVLSILLLDLGIYFQHFCFHQIPLLARIHRMHHADMDLDVTSGARFHPLEMGISMLWKICMIASLGCRPLAVLTFEIFLNGTSMFNHSNVFLPPRWDRIIRSFLVTPDMHRVHHSVIREERNSNYGFALSWWDRLFSTYTAQPVEGHDNMTIGLSDLQDSRKVTLIRILLMPFKK